MEDDLNFCENGRRTHFFKMEDDLNLEVNERQHQSLSKWKMTLILK